MENLPDAVLAASKASHRTLTVKWSNGGHLMQAIRAAELANLQNVKIRIEGQCVSACTVLLSAKEVCIDGDAAFHSAHDGSGNLLPMALPFVRAHTPKAVQAEVDLVNGYNRLELTWIRNERLQKLGLKACD
jgi:hypothetical protein